MSNKKDFNKSQTNLNELLPRVNRVPFLENLNDNLMNKFTTQSEFDHIIGSIGKTYDNDIYSNITEPTQYRQDNQLQPLAHTVVGTEEVFMTFEDFLNKIERTGVNTDKFDEWGKSLQFNWVPPIDLDKFTNYTNYFWDGTDAPQYITIKNPEKVSLSRVRLANKSAVNSLETNIISNFKASSNIIVMDNNVASNFKANDYIIMHNNNGDYVVTRIISSTFNISSLMTDLVIDYNVTSDFDFNYFVNLNIKINNYFNSAIKVSGDLTALITSDYVLSLTGSIIEPIKYLTVAESSYDDINNETRITFKESITETFSWSDISLVPIISSVYYENYRFGINIADEPLSAWDEFDIGKAFWIHNYKIFESNGTGSTTIGSNIFVDNTVNFINLGIQPGYKIVLGSDVYGIVNVGSNILQIDIPTRFFDASALDYIIISDNTNDTLISDTQPNSPFDYQLWVDSNTGNMHQWDGSTWNIVATNVLSFEKTLNDRHLSLYQDNAWTVQNKWIHINDITNFTGKTRARLPILEYWNGIELSTSAYFEHEWEYRATSNLQFRTTNQKPNLIELLNIEMINSDEFEFIDSQTIVLHNKFGNLTHELVDGFMLKLSGFGVNNGNYEVNSSEFVSVTPNTRYQTKIYLKNNLDSLVDTPVGARITPMHTSVGDIYENNGLDHWGYIGIKSIEASSIDNEINPMNEIYVSSGSNANYNYNLGLQWQKLNLTNALTDPIIELDSSLHDLALFDDYQEGDIRIWINGVRIFSNFDEIQSQINPNFVGSIKLYGDFNVGDEIRIELGEQYTVDVGRRAVDVLNDTDNLVNIGNFKLHQQEKIETNQYPNFKLFDIYENPINKTSSIFRYAINNEYPVNPDLLQRIDLSNNTFNFEQELIGENGELYLYHDTSIKGSEYRSIWHKGDNLEQYVPRQVNGLWEIPNQMKYNVEHENRKDVSYKDLVGHFNSIIRQQTVTGIVSNSEQLFYVDDDVNYGIGGTIKEHNGNFDLLMSSNFVENVNIVQLIEFAHNMYDTQISFVKEQFNKEFFLAVTSNESANNSSELQALINDYFKDEIERNTQFDQWFGDSNSDLKNWIMTLPILGVMEPVKPYYIIDEVLDLYQIVHHDGHRSQIKVLPSIRENFITSLKKNYTVTEQTFSGVEAFPNATNVNEYVIRNNLTNKTRKIYRSTNVLTWEELDLTKILLNVILNLEESLYNSANESLNGYDIHAVNTHVDYEKLMATQFSKFVTYNNIDTPLRKNVIFKQNDPFTWNYSLTTINSHPVTSATYNHGIGSWQELYLDLYDTSYPHREPWKLQGYDDKPEWWEGLYTSNSRRWTPNMWTNILNGIVPDGYDLPDGSTSSGDPGEIAYSYNYIPVNIDGVPTSDGVEPDGLLPPYWDSRNSSNPVVRTPYDSFLQEYINTPSVGFDFGQKGYSEYLWNVSSQKLYDYMIVSYKLDPMNFVSKLYGNKFISVDCLMVDENSQQVLSHNDVILHGSADNGDIYVAQGLNQWFTHYNRYTGFDGVSSSFHKMFKEWKIKLGHTFGSFIDEPSMLIRSENFNITERDYDVAIKRTVGIDNKKIQALDVKLLEIPSQYTNYRDKGIGWLTEISSKGHESVLRAFKTENFHVKFDSTANTLNINTFEISDIAIREERSYQIINYNQTLALSTNTNYGALNYGAVITIDGNIINVGINGTEVNNVAEVITSINQQLAGYGSISLHLGDLRVQSNSTGMSSSVQISDNGLFATLHQSFLGIDSEQTDSIKFENIFYIKSDVSDKFFKNDTFEVVDSTEFNGTYTVRNVIYDSNSKETLIYVNENINIVTATVDGVIKTAENKFPSSWETGTEIFLNTKGNLPSPLLNETPYYVIRVDDYNIQLANSPKGASNNIPIDITGVDDGSAFIGRLRRTFKAINGRTIDTFWREHYYTEDIVEYPLPLTIDSIQETIDILLGHGKYLNSIGFEFDDEKGINSDRYGRVRTYEGEVETWIDWASRQRITRQRDELRHEVVISYENNNFNTINNLPLGWESGTRVILESNDVDNLPAPFNNPLLSHVPYFVIRGLNPGEFQLALSQRDAIKGNAIKISSQYNGSLTIKVADKIQIYPSYEINPFRNHIFVNHEVGSLSNVYNDLEGDSTVNAFVLDKSGKAINIEDLIVFRSDKESHIRLTEDATLRREGYLYDLNLFINGIEHVLWFDNYSQDNSLIYDPFIGLTTDRFLLEFNRPSSGYTLRPNMGGYYLHDNKLKQNFESSVNDLRYAYDTYNIEERKPITQMVRRSLGYKGDVSYLSDIGINPKSQFIFWKGMIQNKGTNFSINSFTNQKIFDGASIDEFWAYKVAEFGDNKLKIYPEIKLKPSDVISNELRIEFVKEEETASGEKFNPVSLTDGDRWWDQPEQRFNIDTKDLFYLRAESTDIIENISSNYTIINGKYVYDLGNVVDGVILTYKDINDETQELINTIDYNLLGARYIVFNNDPATYDELVGVLLRYNFDAQNPAKIIDKKSGTVVSTVPIWNPALGQYYHNVDFIIDVKSTDDVAIYNNSIESPQDNYFWANDKEGHVWLDQSEEGYLPYYDNHATSDLNQRLFDWGRVAEWSNIKLYQWVKSDIPPDEWNSAVIQDSVDNTIEQQHKKTGQVYTILYKNITPTDENPTWIKEENVHEEYIAGLVSSGNTTNIDGDVEVYINGKYYSNLDLDTTTLVQFVNNENLSDGEVIHIVKKAHIPTDDELDDQLYMYYTPHSTITKVNKTSGQEQTEYFFWVTNYTTKKKSNTFAMSIYEAEQLLNNMTQPYMIVTGLKNDDNGYGIEYGRVFDDDYVELPYHYNKVVVKGLQGVVKDFERYVLRLTQDFTLRDKLTSNNKYTSSLELSNKHFEWKLFRESQPFKIDKNLWDRITESILGFKFDGNNYYEDVALPTLNRTIYDNLYGADTRFGLNSEQIFVTRNQAIETINDILLNSNRDFIGIDISTFYDQISFETPQETINSMNLIYASLEYKEVNYIFFRILKQAFSNKKEMKEIFKTSWVSIQIQQNVEKGESSFVEGTINLESGGLCE